MDSDLQSIECFTRKVKTCNESSNCGIPTRLIVLKHRDVVYENAIAMHVSHYEGTHRQYLPSLHVISLNQNSILSINLHRRFSVNAGYRIMNVLQVRNLGYLFDQQAVTSLRRNKDIFINVSTRNEGKYFEQTSFA